MYDLPDVYHQNIQDARYMFDVVHTGKVFNNKLVLMFVKLYLSAARDCEKKTPIV